MIFWIVFIGLEIWRNQILIVKKKITPNYLGSFAIRAIFALSALAIMNQDFDPGRWRSWWESAPEIGFEATSFYLCFDPILNLWRKLDIDYRGKESGWLDPILSRTMWWVLKFACVVYLVFYFILK